MTTLNDLLARIASHHRVDCCTCAPNGPFCGACEYDADGELVAVKVHAPAKRPRMKVQP